MSDATERWLPAPDGEGFYEVSDLGEVRSLRKNLILKPSYANTGGYGLVIFYADGAKKGKYVHRLVAEAFLGPCPPGQEVRHKDNNPRNCKVSNLEYGTSGDNKRDQVRHGTHPEARKTHCDNGHEFTLENTRVDLHPDGSFKERVCRACANDATKKRRRNLAETGKRCTSEEGCDGFVWAKDLCEKHYGQQYRAANPRQRTSPAPWIPSAELPPDKLERRRALARERMRRLRERRKAA